MDAVSGGPENRQPQDQEGKQKRAVAGLTDRQQQVMEVIEQALAVQGYPPSVREIGEQLGLASPSTTHSHLKALARKGMIERDPDKPRAIRVIAPRGGPAADEAFLEGAPAAPMPGGPIREVPLVGRIAAGSPILAEEHIEDVVPLPESLVGAGALFMLEVRGDSMTGAGILDGDMVVVRSQPLVENGEIAACLVDGEEATVKRLERRNGRVILHSDNPSYEPMFFTSGVEVLGKVVTVLRRLAR